MFFSLDKYIEKQADFHWRDCSEICRKASKPYREPRYWLTLDTCVSWIGWERGYALRRLCEAKKALVVGFNCAEDMIDYLVHPDYIDVVLAKQTARQIAKRIRQEMPELIEDLKRKNYFK